ncbi:MAG: AMP-binding protein [Gammaproteobacteria bacterium]|nr:AMP-binding protein [Gammaproteobacteria bacterium]
MNSYLSVFAQGDSASPVAWRDGSRISRGEMIAHASALAKMLPDSGWMLNHCEDRYLFAIGFFAAMMRGQVSLFPSSKAPQVLEQLTVDYPGVYCLTDQDEHPASMETVLITEPPLAHPNGDSDIAFASDQLAAIAFTSGSTGKPKTYRRHWGAFVREAEVAGKALALDSQRGGHVVATVPSQHMYGFMTAFIMPLKWGYTLGAERPFYPENIRKVLVSRPTPSVLVTTPVQLRACVLEDTRLPATEFILSSTAPLSADMAEKAETAFSATVKEFYGSTETGAIAVRRQADGQVWTTFDDVSVNPADDGFEVHGRYFYQSPMVLGDSVELLDDRQFRLFGRNADLVKVAGKRISIGDLNQKLLSVDGVEDGAFFLPDIGADGREPRLTAFVVAPGLGREQLMTALRDKIDAVFLPRPLHMVSSLPRNDTGKLPRQNLVRLHEQQIAEAG